MDLTKKLASAIQQSGGVNRARMRRLKVRRWKYPFSIERRYTTAISKYLRKQWSKFADQFVAMAVPRGDAVEDLEPGPGEYGPALGAVLKIGEKVDDFNRAEMDAFRKIAVGDAFTQDEPWAASTVDAWAKEQVTLITKASNDMRDAVARRVRDGVKRGLLAKDVEKLIRKDLPGISFRRARIIARDQVSKLNSSLTQGRMTDAGLETYIWDTAQDERVRGRPGGRFPNAIPSHWEMQGLVCRWDDPTVYRDASGEWVKRPANAPMEHPGMAILCRCVALPNWEELNEI